jgi:glycerol-3-phosphate dehydrogenase
MITVKKTSEWKTNIPNFLQGQIIVASKDIDKAAQSTALLFFSVSSITIKDSVLKNSKVLLAELTKFMSRLIGIPPPKGAGVLDAWS